MSPQWAPHVPLPIHQILKHGEFQTCELIPWGSNYTFCVSLQIDGAQASAVYKPRKGERPLWDFTEGTLYRREFAAFLVSQALGWPFIPPTVIRNGPHGVGSVQLYVEGETPRSIRELREAHDLGLARIALFDFVTNNADRKAGHVLREVGGKLWGIDHGLCFNVVPKVRTVLLHYCGQPVPRPLLEELAAFHDDIELVAAVRYRLRGLIEEEEIDAFLHRLDRVLDRQVYPQLDPYRSVPWPPF